MINELQIQNFQSHKDTELKLSPGVNAIVGLSDAGKSSIIRALRWAIENRPAGEAMRSDWGGDTIITIDVDVPFENTKEKSYQIISRVRTKKWNGYNLTGDEFKAIKSEVPEEIQQALNISAVNLQQQHDRAFLLTNSSGEVAQHFNRIANLEAIDNATKAVRSALREHEQNIKTGQTHLEGLEESLAEFAYLDEYETKIITLEKLAEELVQVESDSVQLKVLYALIEQTKIDIIECQKLTQLEKPVSIVLELYKHLKTKMGEMNSLQNSIQDIEEATAEAEQIKRKLKRLRKEFKENFPDVCPLCGQEVKR